MIGVTRKRVRMALISILVLLGVEGLRAQEKPAAEEPTVDFQWAVKIPARDGVKLNATVFTPHGQKEPLPVHLHLHTIHRRFVHGPRGVFREARLRLRAG